MHIARLQSLRVIEIGLVLTVFGALAFSTLSAHARVPKATQVPKAGFYELDAPFVPPAVRKAADSTFEIYVIDPNANRTLELAKMDATGNKAEDVIGRAELPTQVKQIYLEQIRYCREKGLATCDVNEPAGAGTGFLLGDGQTLWTDYHVIQPYVEGLAKKFKREEWIAFLTLKHQNLSIAVFDKSKRLVFMASKTGGIATVVNRPFDGNFEKFLKGQHLSSSDFIKIRLSRIIGESLKLAGSLPARNDVIFALGYPTGTGSFQSPGSENAEELISRAPFPDAKGSQLHVSPGLMLDSREGLNRARAISGDKPLDELEFAWANIHSYFNIAGDTPNLQRMVFGEIDVIFGNSGGPLVNSRGEVFAMAGSVAVESKDGKYVRTTLISVDMLEVVKGPKGPTDDDEDQN